MTESQLGRRRGLASLPNSIMKAKEIRVGGIWDSNVNLMSLAIVYKCQLRLRERKENLTRSVLTHPVLDRVRPQIMTTVMIKSAVMMLVNQTTRLAF